MFLKRRLNDLRDVVNCSNIVQLLVKSLFQKQRLHRMFHYQQLPTLPTVYRENLSRSPKKKVESEKQESFSFPISKIYEFNRTFSKFEMSKCTFHKIYEFQEMNFLVKLCLQNQNL